MTALADLIGPHSRDRLLERLRELAELERLAREPGHNRPADPPPALHAMTSERTGGCHPRNAGR